MRVREGLRLSPNEERYVLAETLTGQVYTVPSGARLKGPFDAEKTAQALQETCDRHEARRTGFERGPDGTFTKYVEDRARVHLERRYMPGATDEELIAAVNAYVFRKGDLSAGTLHRFMLIELGEKDCVFAFGLHHATSDGVTYNAFVMELYARIFGFPPGDAPAQYSDFWNFDWTGSDKYREAEAFWLDRLGGVGDPGAWPQDRPRAHSQARLGQGATLSPEVVAITQKAAAEIGVTHFSYFYAVFVVLLSRMIGSDTVVTTFQSAGRRGFEGADKAHGVFSNSLMLALRVDPAECVADLARRLRAEVKAAIAHEIYPYHHAIRATGVRSRYAINWMPEMGRIVLDEFEVIPLLQPQNQDDDDLNLRFITREGGVMLMIYYDPTAYEAERVRTAAQQLAVLAEALARDVHRPIDELRSADLAPAGVLPDLSQPLPEGGGETIFARFLARAAEAPQAVAVRHGGQALTYAELEARSRGLARRLLDRGIGSGGRVAILAERGPELIWSMLGAARAGAAFVVLDAAYPEPRLADFAAIAAPGAVVHAGAGLAGLAARLAAEVGGEVLDAHGPDAADADGLDAARPDDPAYFLFTSGSTGRPKCVACSHEPLSHFVDWQAAAFGLSAEDRFSLLSGLSHDPVLRDVFTPLSIGASICIPPARTLGEPGAAARWLEEAGVTAAHLTPQMGRLITAGGEGRLTGLRQVFWGGDRLPREQVAALAAHAPYAAQVSFYGSTETPQGVALQEVDPTLARDFAPLGRGVEGAQLLVVDPEGRPLGVGELGEIAVRSNRLSLGYVEAGRIRPPADRLTGPDGRANIYRTGDRGLYLPDGSVMLVGRADDQVKVRGHRVELSEVVAALQARPGVREAVVLPVGEEDERALAAFVTGPRRLDEAELREALRARLPAYMAPARVCWLERLPLSPNGKLDREALRRRLDAAPAEAAAPPAERPANRTERALIEKWSAVLGGAAVTRTSTFAGLGGDSLSYVQAYLAAEEALGELPDGWPQMTIAELAAAARRPARPGWTTVDMPILMRAAAIALVVAGHYQVVNYGGGATSALMLISGFMLGTLGLREAFAQRTAAPLLSVLRNIFLPTAVLSVLIWVFRLPGKPPEPYILLFTADLQNYTGVDDAQDLHLWFIHGLLHIMAALYLAVLGLQLARRFDIGLQRFLAWLFVPACLLRFALPWVFDHGFFTPGIEHIPMVYFLPTTHLATVVLGAMVAGAVTRRERMALLPVVIGYALASAWCFGPGHAAFALVGGLLLLFLPRAALPRLATTVVFGLAGASLWIYLTHMMVRDALDRLGLAGLPWLGVAIALASGMAAWTLWTRLRALGGRLLGRRAPAPLDATV